MNPLFTWLVSHSAAKALLRECPACHARQIVPKERAQDPVPCKKCGRDIPPRRD